ncbi:MAG: hypothetical protein ACRC5M_02555 [Anaeroplasmataceae bacterium]
MSIQEAINERKKKLATMNIDTEEVIRDNIARKITDMRTKDTYIKIDMPIGMTSKESDSLFKAICKENGFYLEIRHKHSYDWDYYIHIDNILFAKLNYIKKQIARKPVIVVGIIIIIAKLLTIK